MAERQDKSSGDRAEAAKASAPSPQNQAESGTSASPPSDSADSADARRPGGESGLPAVEAPKLGAGETEASDDEPFAAMPAFNFAGFGRHRAAHDETSAESGARPVAAAAQPRSYRFAIFAAIIALAASAGSVAGSLTATGFMRHSSAAIVVPKTADAREVIQSLKAQFAQLSALKLNLESASRSANGQFAKMADRLDSLEHAEADRTAKLTHLAESIDKLDQRASGAPEVTGSIAASPPLAPPHTLNAPILNDWIVGEVHNGRAMVESRFGGYFLVGPGSVLPGLGRVEAVQRQDGGWIVVTSRGVIRSPR